MAEAAAWLSNSPISPLSTLIWAVRLPRSSKTEGAALMRKPDLVRHIVRETVRASQSLSQLRSVRDGMRVQPMPPRSHLSVRKREPPWLRYGRTRDQQYSGTVDLDCIRKVKQALTIPVTGNGDIRSPEDALRMFEETGCDAVMVGREPGQPLDF